MLDIHKLRLFISIAELGSISKAADAHYMTQSAMSQHLAQLEAYLGVALVHRHRRGVTLTADGERLADYAQRIIALIAETEATLMHLSPDSTGNVAIGATPGISTYRLPEWTQGFTTHYPRLTLQVQTGVTGRIIGDVTIGKLDLGMVEGEISSDQTKHLHIIQIETASQLAVVGRGHDWWGRTGIALSALHRVDVIMRSGGQTRHWLDETFKMHNVKPFIRVEMNDPEGIKGMVMRTHYIGILPDYAIHKEIADGMLWGIPIDDVPLVRHHKLLWDKRRRLSPFASAFVQHLQTRFPHIAVSD